MPSSFCWSDLGWDHKRKKKTSSAYLIWDQQPANLKKITPIEKKSNSNQQI